MKALCVLAVLALVGCGATTPIIEAEITKCAVGCIAHDLAAGEQADFYECPPNNTLKTCKPGTVPAGCESVGSGTTTLPLEDC
jgi:hypothetical protein